MIALDVHCIGEKETGNEVYTLNLARALLEAAPERRFLLLTPHPQALPAHLAQKPNARVVRVSPGNSFIRVPLSLPYAAARRGGKLLHVNYVLPPLCPMPGVATVHDLSYDLFPQDAPPRDRLVLGSLLSWSARHAAAVITVSESTKRDVIRRFGIPEERITVTYEAAAPEFSPAPPEEIDRVRFRYGTGPRYILAVGNLQPRKNLKRLVQAFAALRGEGQAVRLVLVGKVRWRESELFSFVVKSGVEKDVVFTGYVPSADLPALYSGAAVFCYPSLYEGFGLPVVEAMACGAPVVAGNVSSLPEVAGEAALLVDPRSVRALTDALRALLSDEALAAETRRLGLAQAARFSWADTARRTLAVYEQVLGSHRGRA